MQSHATYLVIAECPLEDEIRIRKFKCVLSARRYAKKQYGEKWDWQWQIKTVFKKTAPRPIYSFPPCQHTVWDQYRHAA